MTYAEYKQVLGIDELAEYLGYRFDPKAGKNHRRYVLLDAAGGVRDSFYISHFAEKSRQTYWRHSRIGGGDLIAFVREHLGELGATSRNETVAVNEVLRRFAADAGEGVGKRMLAPSVCERNQSPGRLATEAQAFDLGRYDVCRNVETLPWCMDILRSRGFTEAVISRFSTKMMAVRDRAKGEQGYWNLAFPYVSPKRMDAIVGLELRGKGRFKSKAVGSDSHEALWMADFSEGDAAAVRFVCFAESAFDAMAFCQVHEGAFDLSSTVLCSTGGSFADAQIRNVMCHYPQAKAVDCFDRDLTGQLYGIRLMALMADMKLEIVRRDAYLEFLGAEGCICRLKPEEVDVRLFKRLSHISVPRVCYGKVEAPYKDWNEVLMAP